MKEEKEKEKEQEEEEEGQVSLIEPLNVPNPGLWIQNPFNTTL